MQPLPSSSFLLKTIAPKCLMRRRSSGAFCRNPLSSFSAFCSLILGVTARSYQRRCASVLPHCTSFQRSHYIQWHLYDNCTAGDINYAFRRFHVSSHHLLAACIRLDKASAGCATPPRRGEISFPCSSTRIKGEERTACHYLCCTRGARGAVSAESAWL